MAAARRFVYSQACAVSAEESAVLGRGFGFSSVQSDRKIEEQQESETEEQRLDSLVAVYAQNGHLLEAKQIFDRLPFRSSTAWSSMVAAYAQKGCTQESLELFRSMDLEGLRGTRMAYHCVLGICGSTKNLQLGKIIHEEIANCGLDEYVSVASAIIDMYGKCRSLEGAKNTFDRMLHKNVISWSSLVSAYALSGHLDQAMQVFESMPARNAVAWTVLLRFSAEMRDIQGASEIFRNMPEKTGISWNAMISAYAQNGHPEQALELFKEMDLEGVEMNLVSFISAIDACGSFQDHSEGRIIHLEASMMGLLDETAIGSSLVNLYGKCGDLETAVQIFRRMPSCNIRAYNTMLAAYAQNGHVPEAKDLLDIMPKWNVVSWNTMISGYVHVGDLENARQLFDWMKQRDVISWSAMIAAYAQNGQPRNALYLFQLMDIQGGQPDAVTMISALDACASLESLAQGESIHGDVRDCGFDSEAAVLNALINMYGKCGRVEAAKRVFDDMPRKDLRATSALISAYAQNGYMEEAEAAFCKLKHKDVVAWNALIAGYSQHWRVRDALRTFLEMDVEGIHKDKITYLTILGACASTGLKKEGELVAESIAEEVGFESDSELQIAALNLHAKCDNLEQAQRMFERLKEWSLMASSSMIGALCRSGQLGEAKNMFDEMKQHDYVAWKVMVGGFCSNGEEGMAAKMLYLMPQWSTSCWNMVIEAYAQSGHRHCLFERDAQDGYATRACTFFRYMTMEGVPADRFTFVNVLAACSKLVDATEGRLIHKLVPDGLEKDTAVGTALIGMYGNHGCLEEARTIFDNMLQPNAGAWSAMVAGYAHNGHSSQAIDLFRQMQMQGVSCNRGSFTTILNACSHAGLFKQGLELAVAMVSDHGFDSDLDLFISMVDLLGRVGKLCEAEELLEIMPFEPDIVAWTSFVGACRTHGHSELAARAASKMLELQPNNGGTYTVWCNICSGT